MVILNSQTTSRAAKFSTFYVKSFFTSSDPPPHPSPACLHPILSRRRHLWLSDNLCEMSLVTLSYNQALNLKFSTARFFRNHQQTPLFLSNPLPPDYGEPASPSIGIDHQFDTIRSMLGLLGLLFHSGLPKGSRVPSVIQHQDLGAVDL